MPALNKNEKWCYIFRFQDDKHVKGTARLKELDDEDMPELEVIPSKRKTFIKWTKKHWIFDFLPVIVETTIWVWIVGRFFGVDAFIIYMVPFSYLSGVLLVILYTGIHEWFVFNFNKHKVKDRKR